MTHGPFDPVGDRPDAAGQVRPGARRRLLLLSSLPPPPGGIATWTQGLLDSPLRARFELRVVDSSPSRSTVHPRSRFRPGRVLDALRILGGLLWTLLRFRPHLVHVNTPYGWALVRDGAALWLARACGARTVLHFHGGDFAAFAARRGPVLSWLLRGTLRRADRLLVLTRDTRQFLASALGPETVRRVPNFVRLEDLGEPPDRSGRTGPVRVLFVGWIIEAKGIRELLQCAGQLPEARFTLVGPAQPGFVAALRPELEALAGRVTLLPALPRHALGEHYRTADVFVLPSHREGFPNALLEAMAAGLPVVASRVGAIPEMIDDGEEGLLVPPRDPAALRSALAQLVAEPARRRALGRRARRRVERDFALDGVVRTLEGIYDELLDEATPAA